MLVFIGNFNAEDLKKGNDKKAIEKGKTDTGLKYIKNKITKEKGCQIMKVWLTDKF